MYFSISVVTFFYVFGHTIVSHGFRVNTLYTGTGRSTTYSYANNNMTHEAVLSFRQLNKDNAVSTTDDSRRPRNSFLQALVHPVAGLHHVIQSAADALSGRSLTDRLVERDHVFTHAGHPTHLLQDAIELPNEVPLPPHQNTLDAYPNPLQDPLSCHRRDRSESFLCDPDDLLGAEAADNIEAVLAEIRNTCTHPCGVPFSTTPLTLANEDDLAQSRTPCRIAVALARKPPPGVDGAQMARQLLERWNVGKLECQDGVILLYLASEKRPFLHWNRGEEHHLNPHVYAAILPLMKHMFQSTTPDDALRRSLALIEMEQQGEVPSARRLPQLLVLTGITLVSAALFTGCLIAHVTTLLRAAEKRRPGRRSAPS